LAAEVERRAPSEVLIPVDARLVPLGLELRVPVLAVEVEDLVEGEPVAVWRAIEESRTGG